ncbi:Uncharacterized protein DAT39_017859, partial [Clarias magur]
FCPQTPRQSRTPSPRRQLCSGGCDSGRSWGFSPCLSWPSSSRCAVSLNVGFLAPRRRLRLVTRRDWRLRPTLTPWRLFLHSTSSLRYQE